MAARLPSTPPVLPGFTHVHILGKGGFADVFLYEQNLPRRPVAVKVMHADLVDDRVRSAFRSEVNLMGRLSAHPSILTVYSASVAGDGRPYLVMELCSTEIGDRFRERPLELDDALEIMVRVGGALETAHRAGTLHRDVKPANILTTAFGHPVLSDFGIAANMHVGDHETAGVSVPWSAPEVLRDETAGTVASEVWSFGATLYSLVAGRSPAEVRGGRNGTDELSARILAHDIQPFDVDAPRTLLRVVQKALAKDPADRYHAILPMVEDLQAVQEEMGVPITPIDLQERAWAREVDAADDADREEELPLRVRAARRRAPMRGAQQIDISSSTQAVAPPRRKGLVSLAVGAATAAVLGAVAVVAVAVTTIQGAIPVVEEVVAEPVDGGVAFSWEDPGLVDADSYLVTTASGDAVIQRATSFRLSGSSGEELCITVAVNRDGRSGDGAEACGEVP
ncbi:serine/threonine-protein kinase [Agrococcus sp. SGAir0287]|uniref:serine/threonine-protein kinase n=1 Tax=Agrococcus sp. SGAir0287 TaxID=2070347 RepID=UPI0010CD52D1|nr:serine/threonine-protein kinase [Agrococcus sp. SGAir0287]QCR19672.1 serine/threonine protein kinase [Agrococcus sp. SGAir0287]